MADISQIIAEVILQSKEAIAGWKSFGDAGVSAFKRVSGAASSAQSAVNGSLGNMQARLDGIAKGAQKVGAGIKNVGQSISVSFGLPLGLLARTALNAFSESEQAGARLKGQFAATGEAAKQALPELEAFSQEIQKSMPVDDEAVQDLQSTLLKFNNITGKQFRDAREAIIDFSVATGEDLPSAAQKVGQALNDPIRGLRSLREAGIALTVEQKAQIQQWIANGQVYKAQDFIIAQFTKRYHEAAVEIAKTDTSQAIIAANRLDSALEDLGANIIGLKITILNFAASVVEAFNRLPDGLKQAAIAFAALLVALGPILFVIGTIVQGFGGLATAASFLAPILAGVVPTVVALGAVLFEVVAAIGAVAVALVAAVGWPVIIAAALGAIIVLFVTHWEEAKAIVTAALKWIIDKITAAWTGLGDVVNIAIELWKASWNLFFAYLNSKWAGLGDFVREVLAALVSPITNLISLAKELWSWLTKAAAAGNANKSGGGEKKARGGRIRGRAGVDTIPAWLTNNEFVHRVAAVRKYGLGFMNAVNTGRFPMALAQGFASGGLVSRPRMGFATGGLATPASGAGHPFTLVIDGNVFSNLRAPSDTAKEILSFARSRKVRSAGRKPAWYE